MKMLKLLQEKVITTLAVFLFMVSAVWMMIEAISRQVFSASFAISEEVVLFTLIWAIFLTIGQSGSEGYHIAVDLLTRNRTFKVRRILLLINSLVGIFYAAFLVYVSINYIQHLFSTGIKSHSPLRLPMAYVLMAVPIGMSLFALYYVKRFWDSFTKEKLPE